MPSAERPVSLWRNRSFILLVFAYAISAFGDHLLEAAIIAGLGGMGGFGGGFFGGYGK